MSFAEGPSLEDAVRVLKAVSENSITPAFDASGTWAVQSIVGEEVRTGDVSLQMQPNGKISGYAELTTIPGLSTVLGQINGLTFDLEIKSGDESMTVQGSANAEGNSISGIFYYKGLQVSWSGNKKTQVAMKGTYQHILRLNIEKEGEEDIVMEYNILDFTDVLLSLNSILWKRNIGETCKLEGVWKNNQAGEQVITFHPDGKFSISQTVNK
jgi:hypothetical protein